MATRKPKAEAPDAGALVVLPADAPNSTDLMAEVATVCDALCVTIIDSPMMYELAAAELVDLQDKYRALEEKRFSITRPMDAAKKAVMALFNPSLERLDGAIKSLKVSMLDYDREQKRKAAVQQALLDKIAEGQRAALKAEADRQAEEARAQSALAAKLMASGNSAGVDEALTAAENAQAMAAALGQTTQVVSAAVAETGVPNVVGITAAEVWKARVTDTVALLRYIADHPEYHDWIEFKMTGLNDMAKAQRDALRIPGVEVFEESRIAARRKAA